MNHYDFTRKIFTFQSLVENYDTPYEMKLPEVVKLSLVKMKLQKFLKQNYVF